MPGLGRLLVFAGILLVVAGIVVMYADKLPIRLGRLPGDIIWRRGNWTFYLPITTLILINAVLALVLWLFHRR